MPVALHPALRDGAELVEACPATVRLMRVRRGLSMREMGEQVGRKAPWVSKIEKGQLRIGGDDIANLATALAVPVALLGEPIRMSDTEGTHFRALRLPEKVKEFAQAEANFRAHQIDKLLHAAGQKSEDSLPRLDVRSLRGGPEEAARYLREQWDVRGPMANLVQLAERDGMFFTTTPRALPDRVRGLSVRASGRAPHTLISPAGPMDARRHTVAHEIGHLVMDPLSGTASDRDVEERADRFAAELLAPHDAIEDQLRSVTTRNVQPLFELHAYWGVHPKALLTRAARRGDLPADTVTQLHRLLNSRYRERLNELRSPYPIRFRAVRDLLAFMHTQHWAPVHLARLMNVTLTEGPEILDGWDEVFRGTADAEPGTVTRISSFTR